MSPKRYQTMHISVGDDLKRRFHATCVMQGKKMSQVVIELIEQWLESNEVSPKSEQRPKKR